jgi:hypothetical protein
MADNQKAIDAQAARWASIAAKAQGKGPAAIKAAGKVVSTPPPTSSTIDPTLFGQRASEESNFNKKNPPFIYPGTVDRAASIKDNNDTDNTHSTKLNIKRGYIRRLTEYYKNVQGSDKLSNLRCNFQFNPQTISRGVNANYDMQFFFNQSPDQLAQPIPGQSTFSIELLFNREAEVASGLYRGEDGTLKKGNPYKDSLIATNPAAYITEVYDPAWVTEIGVLADLKILDDIIGQGIAQDLITNAANFKTVSSTASSSNKDATDTTNTDAAAGFSAANLGPFASNIGNKAFLVPTPIRLLISELFMVEGFVMSSQVVFNKFTPNMVPTQALVGLQIQALYFGFAQKNTFLSTLNVTTDPNAGNVINSPSQTAADKAIVAQTQQGLENFLATVEWTSGSSGKKNLIDSVFTNAKNEYNFNFSSRVSPSGISFYDSATAKGKTGGGLTFSFSGKITIKWNSYVDGASNSRSVIATSATGGWTYKTGAPPPSATGGISLASWGTASSPLVLSTGDQEAKYQVIDTGSINPVLKRQDTLYFGKSSSQVAWKFDRAFQNIPVPFNEDLFDVDLEITYTATRGGRSVIGPQKIVKSFKKLRADDESLWYLVTLSPGYRKPGEHGPADRI